MSNGTENKGTGSFYTPRPIVDCLLSISGFAKESPNDVVSAKVIDPSCGDGAILARVLECKIRAARQAKFPKDKRAEAIRATICGIELDAQEAQKTRVRLSEIAYENGLDVDEDGWEIVDGDALTFREEMRGRFDYVIGNPPYVRIHNLSEKPESRYIEGMCDLFYAFYDLGQEMLAPGGTLCFISPSSWMNAKAGKAMREDLRKRGVVKGVLDFGHEQIFGNATTYTAITAISTDEQDEISIMGFERTTSSPVVTARVEQDKAWVNGLFVPKASDEVREIYTFDTAGVEDDAQRKRLESISVKMGCETMRNRIFISKSKRFDDNIERKMVKASTGDAYYAIFPYDEQGRIVPLEEMESMHGEALAYLAEMKGELLKRNKLKAARWWGYGRSQGIADAAKAQVTVQNILRHDKVPITVECPAGTGVFSGTYVLGMGKEDIDEALAEETFWRYLESLSVYKSGGYFAISGKEMERYLRWWSARNR